MMSIYPHMPSTYQINERGPLNYQSVAHISRPGLVVRTGEFRRPCSIDTADKTRNCKVHTLRRSYVTHLLAFLQDRSQHGLR